MKSIGILVVFLSISAIASPVAKETVCEEGWESICIDETCNCYKFIDENLPYDVAKQVCNGFGGDLPSVHSEKENRILYVFPSRDDKGAWLGLTRNSSFSFAWSDGTAFDYSSWQADSPSNGANDRNCVHFVGSSDDGYSADFEWRDSSCKELHPVICQKTQKQIVPTTTPTPVPTCPGFNYTLQCFSNGECNCYRMVRSAMRWLDAQRFCRNEGTELISIHSEEENTFAWNLEGGLDVWIGITYDDENWSDGSVKSYSNWGDSEFLTNGNGGHFHHGGIWVDRTWCANTFGTDFNFICKRKLGSVFTP